MSTLCNPDDFFIPEFKDTATIGGVVYDCIRSELTGSENYTDYGQEDGATLYLDFIITDLPSIPAIGSKITFKSIVYRVARAVADSANLTVKCGLVALSWTRL